MRMNQNLILALLLGWLGLGYYLCKDCFCNKDAPAVAAVGAVDGGDAWTVADGPFSASSPEHFRFLKSNSTNLLSYGAGLESVNTSTKEYIMKDGTKGINVLGYYSQDEKNDNPLFENLGMARANEVKQKLIQQGIDAKRISLSSELVASPRYNGDTLLRGAKYAISTIEDNTARLAEVKSRLVGKPIVLYFKVNSNELDMTTEQQKQFADLFYYLDNVKDAKLEVSGHTDSDGKKASNKTLSEKRATFIKQYLIDNGGVSDAAMSVSGVGPDRPIASNSTAEGKAKNRRVEVVLK
jgi:OmpA-OmpF porin, OOP family